MKTKVLILLLFTSLTTTTFAQFQRGGENVPYIGTMNFNALLPKAISLPVSERTVFSGRLSVPVPIKDSNKFVGYGLPYSNMKDTYNLLRKDCPYSNISQRMMQLASEKENEEEMVSIFLIIFHTND